MALGILGAFYLRARFAISPDAVYNHAMAKLNADPAVLEVLGGPVLGSELRAFVQTGGGLRLKWAVSASETPVLALSTPSTPRDRGRPEAGADSRPLPAAQDRRLKFRSRRIHMIFPISGSQVKDALVSLEAKKQAWRYQFKLLAVDLAGHGQDAEDARLYLAGDATRYGKGGVLNVLREPFLQAAGAEMEAFYEDDDDLDEQEEAEGKGKEAADAGGMYFYEHVWDVFSSARSRLRGTG